jgi:AcrR family transcriptional regulator
VARIVAVRYGIVFIIVRSCAKGTTVAKRKPAPAAVDEHLDERVRRSKHAVLAATFELLGETGLAGVSVDAVSERSGVAKTTIYRHWPSRAALLIDACAKMSAKREPPQTGSLAGDVAALMKDLAHRLQTARFAATLPSVIDAAERDREIARVHAQLHAGLISAFRSVIEDGQRRGELPRDREPTAIVAMLLGPLFYRRWFSREPLDGQFVKAVIENALANSSKQRGRER